MNTRGNSLIPGIFLSLLTFLLPLKFGSLAAVTEYSSFFPPHWGDYLNITWPVHVFGIFAAFAFLLTLLCRTEKRTPSLLTLFWSFALPLAALPGCFVSGCDADAALGIFSHFTALGIWLAAVERLFAADVQWRKILPVIFLSGLMITAIYGYYQHFVGLEETRAYLKEQLASGVPIAQALVLKMADPRIFSFMASSNALAGVLLLAIVPTAYGLCKAGERFEPVKVSRILLPSIGVLVLLGALALTRARSAFVVVVLCAALAFFSHQKLHWRWKIAAAFAALLLLTGGVVYALRAGRGLASGVERLDYWRSSALMCAEKPLAGHGWGGFFFFHMREKQSSTDESARDPHNILAAFASQSGIPAALVVFAALLCPLIQLWESRFDGMKGAVFWSGVAFTLHLMMDCDMLITAIMAGMLMLYASVQENSARHETLSRSWLIFSALLALVSVAANFHFLRGEYAFSLLFDRVHPTTQEQMLLAQPVLPLYENARSCRPKAAMLPELVGEYYANQRDYPLAEEYFRRSLALEPRRPGIYRRLAALAMLREDRKNAQMLMEQAAKLFPRNPKYRVPVEELLSTP